MTIHKKACCRCCPHKCKKDCIKNKKLKNARHKCTRSNNFIFASAKCIKNLYHWAYTNIFVDEFLTSLFAAVTLFAIGITLTTEINFWKLYTTKWKFGKGIGL